MIVLLVIIVIFVILLFNINIIQYGFLFTSIIGIISLIYTVKSNNDLQYKNSILDDIELLNSKNTALFTLDIENNIPMLYKNIYNVKNVTVNEHAYICRVLNYISDLIFLYQSNEIILDPAHINFINLWFRNQKVRSVWNDVKSIYRQSTQLFIENIILSNININSNLDIQSK